MKTSIRVIFVVCVLMSGGSAARAQGTAFTYQGRLSNGTNVANGVFDLRFGLYDSLSGGLQIGPLRTNAALAVSNGLFTVSLDFTNGAFPGADRWLEISARTNGTGAFTTLNPRQKLTAAPYAVTASNLTGTLPASQLTGTLSSSQLSGTYSGTLSLNNGANSFTGNGAGLTSLNGANLQNGTVTANKMDSSIGVWTASAGNVFRSSGNVGIGISTPQERLHIADRWLRVDGLGDERAYLGGDGVGGEVQVGSLNPSVNSVLLWNAGNNTAMDLIADQITANQFNGPLNGNLSGTFTGTVLANSLKVGSSSVLGSILVANDTSGNTVFEDDLRVLPPALVGDSANVVGGRFNAVAPGTSGAAIGGGGSLFSPNYVSASYGTVVGGLGNAASNTYATVLGGRGNIAAGSDSIAGGRRARANHAGAIVFSDSQNSDFVSSANNQFLIRASGNVGINTTNPLTPLHVNGYAARVEGLGGEAAYLGGDGVGGDVEVGSFNAAISDVSLYNAASGGAMNLHAGSVFVDSQSENTGSVSRALIFGGSGSGEAIGSQRSAGDNQYGLDFYAGSSRRMSLRLNGEIFTHNNSMYFRSPGDLNHGVGYRSTFAGQSMDGVAMFGYNTGVLGTKEGGENWALRWNKDGEVRVKVLTIEGGADLAEPFAIKEETVEPGSVVIIDEEHPGRLKLSGQEYDSRVAGIVSGANGVNPGIALRQAGVLDEGKNVALTGRVYVRADANNAAIKPGDLLTTSDVPGHAMKVRDHARAQGAVLGKAMSGLETGRGMVLVLVTLQ